MIGLVIRPDVRFFCDLNFDPFLLMQDEGKVYGMVDASMKEGFRTHLFSGFTISLYEYEATIPTLWSAVRGKQEAAKPGLVF
jgi:alpha 1,2-mannosyltransferase